MCDKTIVPFLLALLYHLLQSVRCGFLVYSTAVDSQYDFQIVSHNPTSTALYSATKFLPSHYISRMATWLQATKQSGLSIWVSPASAAQAMVCNRHIVTIGEKGGERTWKTLSTQICSFLGLRIHTDCSANQVVIEPQWTKQPQVVHCSTLPMTSPYLRGPHCPVLLRNWATE